MQAPDRLGKYLIRHELGRGAMGVVYEGHDPFIERPVAIKVLRVEEADPALAGELRLRFRREAQAAGRLAHPGIVAIHEYGEDPTHGAFIAMELVRGRDLKSQFDAGRRFSLVETGALMDQLLAALQHAHERGVVHRDIKPGNIIMVDDGGVKIADFGIAKLDTSELTQLGSVLGTVSHMAPEQLTGDAVDRRSDLYACGVILYQLLTGVRPFTGSPATVMHQVLHVDPPAPSSVLPSLPPALDAVVRTAMAKQPSQRFADARSFARALREALARTTDPDETVRVPLQPYAAAGSGAATSAAGDFRTSPPSATRTEARVAAAPPSGRRALPMAALGLAAMATVAAGVWTLRSRDARPARVATAASAAAVRIAAPTSASAPDAASASAPLATSVASSAPDGSAPLAVAPTPSAAATPPRPVVAAPLPNAVTPGPAPRPVPIATAPATARPAETAPPARSMPTIDVRPAPPLPFIARSDAGPGDRRGAAPGDEPRRTGPAPAAAHSAAPASVAPAPRLALATPTTPSPANTGAIPPPTAPDARRSGTTAPAATGRDEGECLQEARRGDAHCQFVLGRNYLAGRGVPQDPVEGARWVRKAADQGLDVAQLALGQLYAHGTGVAKNDIEAMSWYRKSAAQGNVRAQNELGIAYEKGTTGQSNPVMAAEWYRRAAEGGLPAAQYNLAHLYFTGRGVFKDTAQGQAWLERAANGGEPNAMVVLARMLQKGEIKARDPDLPMRLYREALKHPGLSDGNREFATRAVAAAR
jgi:serine/threonine protein kinase/TPR repeat protein